MIGFCPCCRKLRFTIKKRRQNTAYVDDSMNWFTGCKPCDIENEAYWQERWDEYYSQCY